jgi:hypothetical protein
MAKMASEHAYSKGQLLRALITSFRLGVTMKSILAKWEPRDEDSWDGMAMDLQRSLVAERTERITHHRQMALSLPVTMLALLGAIEVGGKEIEAKYGQTVALKVQETFVRVFKTDLAPVDVVGAFYTAASNYSGRSSHDRDVMADIESLLEKQFRKLPGVDTSWIEVMKKADEMENPTFKVLS